MTNIDYNDYGVAAALGQLAQAQEAQAMRPQKSSVFSTTTSTSTPRALEDMIMRRNLIGAQNQNLLNALKGRESFGYNVGSGLANLAPVQGYGDWGVNALRAFGGAMSRPTDAQIAREQVAQELAQKDLETALAFDKAMGETQTQTQDQTIGYKELPYSNTGKGANSSVGGGSGIANYLDLPDIDVDALNKKAGSWETNEYNPSDQNQSWMKNFAYRVGRGPEKDYGVALSKKTDEAKAFEQFKTEAMQGMFDVLKYLRPATDTDVMVALSTAGADPVLDRETRDQRLTKTLNQELRKGGLAPINNLRHWQDTVQLLKQTNEWNPQGALRQKSQATNPARNKQNLIVGEVRNGIRFLGYNEDGSMKFEKVQ